jgi:hypothetical protein
MRTLFTLVALFVGNFAAAEPPGDYEIGITYQCVCSCYDYQPTATRVRVPGGGYGYEYLHHPLYNPLDPQRFLTAFIFRATQSECRSLRGQCQGMRDHRPGSARFAGYVGGCRWEPNYY